MLHRKRIWVVAEAESAERLSHHLTQCTWCGCNGFRLGRYLFVNDATSPDGAQEYAVLRSEVNDYVQIESLTFSWMNECQALEIIQRVLAGEFDKQVFGEQIDRRRLQTPTEHRQCQLCI
jgi:hypothetical protein